MNTDLFVVVVVAYTRTTWYSKSKTNPRHFFAQKLRKFSANSLVKMSKLELSIKSWKLVSTPPPTNQTWEFGILANLDSATKVGNWLTPTNPPPSPPPDMGIWDFSKFGLSIKSWKLVSTNPLPPTDMGIWDFSKFGLSIKSWKLVPNNPPSPQPDMGIWDFSKFGLSIKIWKLVSTPPPCTGHGNLGFFWIVAQKGNMAQY